jgi:hypothetical protein
MRRSRRAQGAAWLLAASLLVGAAAETTTTSGSRTEDGQVVAGGPPELSDVPRYPGSRKPRVLRRGDSVQATYLVRAEDPDGVMEFFREQMPVVGWTEQVDLTRARGDRTTWALGDRRVVVTSFPANTVPEVENRREQRMRYRLVHTGGPVPSPTSTLTPSTPTETSTSTERSTSR